LRQAIIGQRQKCSTTSSRWFTVVISSATMPVASRPGFDLFCLRPTTLVVV